MTDSGITLSAAAGAVVVGVLGLLIGSFLNVVVWRVPRGESIVSPPSACPHCGHRLSWWENVPVVSFAVLRGRCRSCRASISLRYPLVELSTAAVFLLVFWRFGVAADLPAFLYLGASAVALALIDLEHRRLPDSIVLPAYPVLVVLLSVAALATGEWDALLRAAIGGAALFAFYFAIAFAYPSGMGFGDVKLAGVLGLALGWAGWGALVVGAFSAFLVGAVVGVAVAAVRRTGRKTAIPFGPFMILGAALGIAFGTTIADAYLSLLL
jgi:leader peptidase (prepilin peptidase)/N-methyltransferase